MLGTSPRGSFVTAAMLLAVALAARPAAAQAPVGNIAGVVTDPSGAVLRGATVTVTSLSTGATTRGPGSKRCRTRRDRICGACSRSSSSPARWMSSAASARNTWRCSESYARFFHHYEAAPVLTVNSENLNFVERDADFELLVGRLRAMKSRREFFNLG